MRSVVLLTCVTLTIASELSFDLHIVERPVRYVQKVVTDLAENHVTYHVPSHNNVLESHKIQDFKKGIQITCLPSIRECHLLKLDTDINTDAGNTTESIVHMWNKGVNSIDENECNVIRHKVILSGPEIKDTTNLSQNMRKFLAKFGFPLYPTKPLPPNAIIGHLPPVNVSSIPLNHGPSKRESISELKCGSLPAASLYGYTKARNCNHLYMCTGTPHPSVSSDHLTCGNQHINVNLFYKCLCCRGYFTLDDPRHCKCFRFNH